MAAVQLDGPGDAGAAELQERLRKWDRLVPVLARAKGQEAPRPEELDLGKSMNLEGWTAESSDRLRVEPVGQLTTALTYLF